MRKRIIWYFNVAMAIAIVVLIHLYFRKPSLAPYSRAVARVATAIEQFQKEEGRFPSSLGEIGGPEMLAFRELRFEYEVLVDKATVSLVVSNSVVPVINTGNSKHNWTKIVHGVGKIGPPNK